MQIVDAHCFDVKRTAAVYADNAGHRWWTKAWFNEREKGEKAIEVSREMAAKFITGELSKDAWLSRYYPKQMNEVSNAVSKTRRDILGANY